MTEIDPLQTRRLRCEVCSDGWVDGPYTAPDYCQSIACTACDGTGWIDVEFISVDEDDMEDIDAALAAAEGRP